MNSYIHPDARSVLDADLDAWSDAAYLDVDDETFEILMSLAVEA